MNERIRELAFEAAGGLLRFDERGFMLYEDELEKFAELVRADEREACAKLAEEGTDMPVQVDALKIIRAERNRIAEAIRARGET